METNESFHTLGKPRHRDPGYHEAKQREAARLADMRELRRRADNLLAGQHDGLALWTGAEQTEAGDVIEALLATLAHRSPREREAPDAAHHHEATALVALVAQRVEEDAPRPDSEYCWHCQANVNGKHAPVEPHTSECWWKRAADALRAPREE